MNIVPLSDVECHTLVVCNCRAQLACGCIIGNVGNFCGFLQPIRLSVAFGEAEKKKIQSPIHNLTGDWDIEALCCYNAIMAGRFDARAGLEVFAPVICWRQGAQGGQVPY